MFASLESALEPWRDFYVLVGTAAAALAALLFVAASVGVGVLTPGTTSGTRTYMTPVVAHFAGILFACAVCLVPSHTRASLGLLVGLDALVGGTYAVVILVAVIRDRSVVFEDRIAYSVIPFVGYAAALVAAFFILVNPEVGLDVLAGALIMLLLVGIRNAWDLTLYMVRKHPGAH